jgi:hypothetical protein
MEVKTHVVVFSAITPCSLVKVKDKVIPEKINSVALVRERTMPTERPPLVSEVVPTFADRGRCVVSATDPPDR